MVVKELIINGDLYKSMVRAAIEILLGFHYKTTIMKFVGSRFIVLKSPKIP